MRLVLLISIFFSLTIGHSNAQSVTLSIRELKDDGENNCKVIYNISNDSFGTLNQIYISFTAIDDRGEVVAKQNMFDRYAFTNYDDFYSGYKRTPIPWGANMDFETDDGIYLSCKYIEKIVLKPWEDKNCGIRMLPEDVICNELLEIHDPTGLFKEKQPKKCSALRASLDLC